MWSSTPNGWCSQGDPELESAYPDSFDEQLGDRVTKRLKSYGRDRRS
jgi:hypothetical protein